MPPPILRFAPSPTGYLHLGNLRPALLNWCVAKREGGRFILRFDDTDRERSREAFLDAARADLAWIGIRPDLELKQSARLALYDAALARLKAAGLAYACYETADELERRRRRQLARGQPPVYDRAALALTDAERAALAAQGRRPYWRFRLPDRTVTWDDGVRGASHIDTATLSDPVLVRADGTVLYTFASVVDDIDTGVTLVLRGEDHVTNTAVQIALFEALGAMPPAFAHHNLLVDARGEGFSKREGSLSLRTLREEGYEPMALASLAALTGTAEAVRPLASLDELARLVSLDRISRAPARFEMAELAQLNARLLHAMSCEEARPRLAALGIGGGDAFWIAVRGNLSRFADVAGWWVVVAGAVTPMILDGDGDFLRRAADLLPVDVGAPDAWRSWTGALKTATGRAGKALFRPLRLALTAREDGPEMAMLLPLIGRERALRRLSGETA